MSLPIVIAPSIILYSFSRAINARPLADEVRARNAVTTPTSRPTPGALCDELMIVLEAIDADD